MKRVFAPRPAHAVQPQPGVDHRADSRCPCQPIPHRDLETPSRLIYVHRLAPQETPR